MNRHGTRESPFRSHLTLIPDTSALAALNLFARFSPQSNNFLWRHQNPRKSILGRIYFLKSSTFSCQLASLGTDFFRCGNRHPAVSWTPVDKWGPQTSCVMHTEPNYISLLYACQCLESHRMGVRQHWHHVRPLDVSPSPKYLNR